MRPSTDPPTQTPVSCAVSKMFRENSRQNTCSFEENCSSSVMVCGLISFPVFLVDSQATLLLQLVVEGHRCFMLMWTNNFLNIG